MADFIPTLFTRKVYQHTDGRKIVVREDVQDRLWHVDLLAPDSGVILMRQFADDEHHAAAEVTRLIGDEPGWRDESPHEPED